MISRAQITQRRLKDVPIETLKTSLRRSKRRFWGDIKNVFETFCKPFKNFLKDANKTVLQGVYIMIFLIWTYFILYISNNNSNKKCNFALFRHYTRPVEYKISKKALFGWLKFLPQTFFIGALFTSYQRRQHYLDCSCRILFEVDRTSIFLAFSLV